MFLALCAREKASVVPQMPCGLKKNKDTMFLCFVVGFLTNQQPHAQTL